MFTSFNQLYEIGCSLINTAIEEVVNGGEYTPHVSTAALVLTTAVITSSEAITEFRNGNRSGAVKWTLLAGATTTLGIAGVCIPYLADNHYFPKNWYDDLCKVQCSALCNWRGNCKDLTKGVSQLINSALYSSRECQTMACTIKL